LLGLRSNYGHSWNSWNSFVNACFDRSAMNSMHGVATIYIFMRRMFGFEPSAPVGQPYKRGFWGERFESVMQLWFSRTKVLGSGQGLANAGGAAV
jgi:hypothetical protein